jgi:hypothetical protein
VLSILKVTPFKAMRASIPVTSTSFKISTVILFKVAVNSSPVGNTSPVPISLVLPKLIDIGFSNTGIEIFPEASIPTLFSSTVKPNPVKLTLPSETIISFPKTEVIS